MKKTFTIISFVIAIFAFGQIAAQSIIQVSQKNEGLGFNQNSLSGLSGSLNLSSFKASVISTEKGEFTRLALPGYTGTYNTGQAEMPAYRKLIRVPLGATANIEIINAQYKEINLEDHGFPMPVYPSQPPRSKNVDEHEFIFDEAAYKKAGFSQHELLSIDMLGILRDNRIARINFIPFQYDPVAHKVRVYYTIEFRITYENADIPATLSLKEKYASPAFQSVNNRMINVSPENNRENFKLYPVKYVIISDRMFESQLQPLIEWKTRKGFMVVEAYTDEPAVGSSLASIKSYIQGLYNAGTPEDPAPSYILFVGDIQQIPTYNNGNGVTDRNYVEFTGDVFPEIYYGRFSAQNPAQLQPYIDKTLQYEQYTMPDPDYLNEVVMIAGVDASFGYDWANGQINYGTINYFNEDHGITSHTYLYPQSGSSSALIQQNISDGVTFGNYTAHCSPNGWANPSFTIADIANLQNQDMYCVLIGNCCSSSEYQLNECFGEAIVRAEDKGAVGYIGGSNSTYWDEDYYFAVGVGEISQNPPSYYETGLGNYDRSFHDHGEEFSEWYVSGDEIIFAGNLAVSESGSSLEQYYWDIYNYIGDPSLMVYYSNPPPTTATYIPLLPLQSTSLVVTTEPYAYVGLSLDNQYIAAALADDAGIALLEFPPLATEGNADIVVTRQNGQPFFGTIIIASPTGPYLMLDDVEIDDESGNNNGFADFGENVFLDVSLENVGNGDAINTVSLLIGSDDYITVTKNSHDWPPIPGQSTLTEPGTFAMQIASDVPDQHTVAFDIEIETPAKEIWNYAYDLVINAPELTIASMIIDDSQTGNGNGRLDPGEEAIIKIVNKNTGHCETYDAVGQLSSMSQYLSFGNNTYTIGTLGLLGFKYSEFAVTVDPDAPNGAAIAEFDYILTSGEYMAEKSFSEKIGLIVEDFETGDFSKFEWEMDGDVPWQVINAYPYEGVYSARSGAITDMQSSEMSVDVEVMIADTISFVYKISSQTNKDKLTFYIDNTIQGSWSGVGSSWTEEKFYISTGVHTLKWIYDKDASGMAGYDCAWLDYICFPPLMTLTCYAGPDAQNCQGESFQCQGEATDWVSVEWTTQGDGTFDDPTILQPIYTPGSGDISNGNVMLSLTATDIDNEVVDDEMILSLIDIPEQPAMPDGPTYVNLNNVTSSTYTVEGVQYAGNYEWAVEPAEAGDIMGMGTTAEVNWNNAFLGTALISVKAANMCGESVFSDALEVTVDNVVNIAEPDDKNKLYVYPNPGNGTFKIATTRSIAKANISIHNIVGEQIIDMQKNIGGGEVISIDLGAAPDGIYILSITTEKERYTRKLIVQ